ncbi:uncharacterized protein LOC141866573 [Acropora palmata]|uniref:uncharacterized protein LOC141866573 n=1 Tax=Acropora palmata TaxID=6131 RepID=UPI003DA1A0C8
MSERRLMCVACSDPSPGPIKRLYYQTRKHGPFFPILATLKHSGNASLFTGGRVTVCTGCSSHLQRQWMAYEKSWTPLEKRSYTLLAVEREHKDNEEHDSQHGGQDGVKRQWRKAAKVLTTQQQVIENLRHDDHAAPLSRFKLAAHRVQQDLEPKPVVHSLRDVVELTRDASEGNGDDFRGIHLPALQSTSPTARMNWGMTESENSIQRKMRENSDILIRKIADIQYEENLRQSQETIREALDRVRKAQDRVQFVHGLERELRERLQGELDFREANRGLQADDKAKRDSEERNKNEQKHKQILQELKKEREWQRRTETMIAKQEMKIEELRHEVKTEIRGIIEEQNKHHEEMKQMLKDSRLLMRHHGSDQAYVSLDGSTRSALSIAEEQTLHTGRELKTPTGNISRASTPEYYIQ